MINLNELKQVKLVRREARKKIHQAKAELEFVKRKKDRDAILVAKKPEKSIAFEERLVRKLYEQCGFQILEPIYFGRRHGKMNPLFSQDIIIAIKN